MSRVDVRALRRGQILDAAEQLVAKQGWARTSFADICEAAGITNGVLTYHFRNKDDLFLALFMRGVERWKANYGPVEERVLSPRERATASIGISTRRMAEEPAFFRLLLHYLCEATGRPETATYLKDLFAGIRDKMVAKMTQDAAAGATLERDPAVAASVIQTVIFGYTIGRIALDLDPPEEELIDLLTNYLSTAPTQ